MWSEKWEVESEKWEVGSGKTTQLPNYPIT